MILTPIIIIIIIQILIIARNMTLVIASVVLDFMDK